MRSPFSACTIALLLAATVASAESPVAVTPATTRPSAVVATNVPLDEFLDTIREAAAGLNLAINWPALEAVGVDRSTPISLRIRGLPVRRVLDLALREAGQGKLAWYVSDGVVVVTSRELADRAMVTRVYPVQDLVLTVPNFAGSDVSASSDSGGDAEGGSSSSLFSGGSSNNNASDTETRAARGERLCDLIRTVVRPEIWIENGGVASVRYFAGSLIVTAPRDVQQQIGK